MENNEVKRAWNDVDNQRALWLLGEHIHRWAENKGFWPECKTDRNFGEMIALIHSELSEALEGHRKGYQPDEHCPDFSNVTIELADTIIRILDLAAGLGLCLPEAIAAKMNYNETRPHKHGKQY